MPYCTRCGKLMKEGSKFCTACGAPLEEPEQAADRTVVLPQDEATRVIPHAEPAQPSSTASMPAADPEPTEEPTAKRKSKTPLVIALVVAIAAVLILAFVLLNGNFLPGNNTRSDSATTEQTDSDAAKNAKNGTGKVEVKGDPNVIDDDDDDGDADDDDNYEQTVYDELTRYYDDLEGLDASIRSCATEFNQNYLETDYTTRQDAASAASRVGNKIDDAIANLKDLDVDRTSKNYSSWRNILNLYRDLDHRIDVITDAWGIDLMHDDPSSHKDEIVEPLSADNVPGTNDNKYRLDYEKNYAGAKPVEP